MPKITGTLILPMLASAPASPQAGQVYYDTTTNMINFYNGTAWIALTTRTTWL